MSRRTGSMRHAGLCWSLLAVCTLTSVGVATAQQKNDDTYTKRIHETLRDPRITTELVDHLPASSTVPTPLKHFGHIIGEWGVLDKSSDMDKYLASIAKAAPARAKY